MNEIKKKIAIISIGIIIFGAIIAVITGNFFIGREADKEPVINAIQNTYNSKQMEYNYTFQGRIAYKIAGVFGPWADAETSGNVKWNSDETLDSNFIVYRESSGLLLFDTSEYIYNVGDSVFVDKIDDDANLTFKNTQGDFDSTYTFETDIFGDILSSITESDITSLVYYEDLDKYSIQFSNGIKGAFANQMSNLAQTAFSDTGSSNPVGLNLDCEISLENGYINTYKFAISLEVIDVELSFEFNQSFVTFENVTIEIPQHDNVIIGEQLSIETSYLSGSLSTFFSESYSNYSFDYRNQIDQGVFHFSLGTDFRGTHIVNELNDIQYFNNYFELDSDYKPDLTDKKQSIALLNNENNECWLEIFNILTNDYELVDDYNSQFQVHFTNFDYNSLINNIEFIVIEVDEDKTEYKLGVSGDSIFLFFNLLNESIEYQAYQYKDNLIIGALEISIITNQNDIIQEINIFSEGKYLDINDVNQNFTIKLDYVIGDLSIDQYEIPTTKENVN